MNIQLCCCTCDRCICGRMSHLILPRVSLLAQTRCTPVKLPGPMVARQLIIISLVQHKLLSHKVVQGDIYQQFADYLHVTLKKLHHLGAQAWTESSEFTKHARAWQNRVLHYLSSVGYAARSQTESFQKK